MDKICGVVDIQGFQFKNYFVPREMAVVSDNFSVCVEIDPEMDFKTLSAEEKRIAIATTRGVHGLHLYAFLDRENSYVIPSDRIWDYLIKIYKLIGSDEKPYLAVKSPQTLELLKDCQVPLVDLNDKNLNFPKYQDIQREYGSNYICGYHKKPIGDALFKCAYRKCSQLLRKIRDYELIPKMEE